MCIRDRLRDLEEKNKILTNKLGTSYTELDPKRKQMLLDIQFNVRGGIDSFPKFTEAVLDNDINTMQKEYKRYFKNKENLRFTGKPILLTQSN